jgi:hypothetical protein
VAYNFQSEKNKLKLLAEYETVTQKALFFVESLFEFHFHIPEAVLFCCFQFDNCGPRNFRQ